MAKYIDAERLRKEVKRLEKVAHKSALGCADSETRKFHEGKDYAYQHVGILIGSLQPEQQKEPDKSLEEAAYKYSFDSRPSIYGQVDVIDAFKAGANWQYQKDRGEFAKLKAKEWSDGYNEGVVKGAASQRVKLYEEGLDAVHQDNPSKIEKTIAGVFVKYGMDRMKEQMFKDAIHYVVQDDLDSHGASYNIPFIRIGMVALKPKGIGVGDKVRIVVIKEEE